DFGFDGMRCDVDGNLYVTRHGKGTVVVLSPAGKVLREVGVLGSSPSNLCFGGPDGRTVYVTEVEKRRLVRVRVDRPGLAGPCRLTALSAWNRRRRPIACPTLIRRRANARLERRSAAGRSWPRGLRRGVAPRSRGLSPPMPT